MIDLVIICLTFLFGQIGVTIFSLTNLIMIDDFFEIIQFNDSKNGRITGLIFFNIIPIIPVIYIGIKELIKTFLNTYPSIKDAINGEKE